MAKLQSFARFWMVCRKPTGPHSTTAPKQRYSTFEDAQRSAEKLAQQNDAQFVILEAVAIANPTDASFGSLL